MGPCGNFKLRPATNNSFCVSDCVGGTRRMLVHLVELYDRCSKYGQVCFETLLNTLQHPYRTCTRRSRLQSRLHVHPPRRCAATSNSTLTMQTIDISNKHDSNYSFEESPQDFIAAKSNPVAYFDRLKVKDWSSHCRRDATLQRSHLGPTAWTEHMDRLLHLTNPEPCSQSFAVIPFDSGCHPISTYQ